MKSGFKRTINWNKYQLKVRIQAPNSYLDYLIDLRYQGVNRLFILPFENTTGRTVQRQYYLPTLEIKDYNVTIDEKHFFDQPVKNNLRTYDNIRKIETGKGDDYTTSCLLYCTYFNKYYNMIAVDLSK